MKRVFRLNKELGFVNLWSKKYRHCDIGWDLSNNGCNRITFCLFNLYIVPTYITIEIINLRWTFDLVEV